MTTEKVAATETTKAVIPPAREYIETDDGLTDEEREALADGGEEGDGVTAQAEGDEPEVEAEPEEEAPAPAAAEEAAAPATAEPEQEAAPAAAPTPAQTVAPVLVAAPAAEAEAKLADIEAQKADALTKFDDGDLTAREYQEMVDKLGKEERKLEREIDRAKLAGELQEQAFQNAWMATVNGFVAAHPVYDARTNPRMNRMLDAEVRDIANAEPNLDGAAILAKAHANLVEAGIVAGTTAPAAAAGKPGRAPIPKKDLPPTLARVPVTDASDTDGNRFASLDRLQATAPLEYEERLMKMSDSERRAYEAA